MKQVEIARNPISVLQISSTSMTTPRVSPRTFLHCLNALFVNTQVLAANVISLHLYAAGQEERQEESNLLSHFHLELEGQTFMLRQYIEGLYSAPVLSQEWVCYADLWCIADVKDVPNALLRLAQETDFLAALYERILPISAAQPDQSISLYLLAEHLGILNSYFKILQVSGPWVSQRNLPLRNRALKQLLQRHGKTTVL